MPDPRRRLTLVYLLTLAGSILWIGAIVLAPVLREAGSPLSAILYGCFAPACHQVPERSFFLLGHPLAVCARCFGIYAGFLGGMILYPFLRGFDAVRLPRMRSFLLASLPVGLDTAGNILGLWNTANLPRFLLGFAWGTSLPFYALTALGELALAKLAIPAPKK
jgi:uncharacterized membrane protein